jgi:high-affinity iron transporter
VVLFLQSLRLRAGSQAVLEGVSIGLGLTLIVAYLTFVAHRRLPYHKMLVLTGAMLAIVLMVMVGEQVQEMQLAGWVGTTALNIELPGWAGMWFAIFPNVQGLLAQLLALIFVVGSYFLARAMTRREWKKQSI